MDRRKKRTSTNQYMMYIEMMEKDPIFATGRIPRDVDMNYLHERWKELSDKLNTCTGGPKLTAGEWRKRLNDWKNTTRCKYRRSTMSEDITLTALELKALKLFGNSPNLNNSTEELSISLKSEKDENEDDMDPQQTSETFQKELQAAVEEAIGQDEDEEVMDEQDERNEVLSDPLPIQQQIVTVSSGSGGGSNAVAAGGEGGAGTNNHKTNLSTTYRTIVVENAQYSEAEESEQIDFISQRRQNATTSSSISNTVATKPSNVQTIVTTAGGASVTKVMMNGEVPLKRTRSQGPGPIIYEVAAVKKLPLQPIHPPPLQMQQQNQQQPQRIIRTIPNSDPQHHHSQAHQPASNTATTATSFIGSSADGREIARQLKRMADIKAEKLKFEVARFKFNNPGFVFNLNQI